MLGCCLMVSRAAQTPSLCAGRSSRLEHRPQSAPQCKLLCQSAMKVAGAIVQLQQSIHQSYEAIRTLLISTIKQLVPGASKGSAAAVASPQVAPSQEANM